MTVQQAMTSEQAETDAKAAREWFRDEVAEMVRRHGVWAVLLDFTEAIRPAMKAEAERKRASRPQ